MCIIKALIAAAAASLSLLPPMFATSVDGGGGDGNKSNAPMAFSMSTGRGQAEHSVSKWVEKVKVDGF